MNTINVCFITDNGYCKPTATAIASLINNKSKNDLLEIYIICDGVSEENKNKLLKLSKDTNKIHIVEAAGLEQYKNMFENPNISATTAALYKFLIPNFLANLDKVVYLDGDVLVLHSLSSLWNLDITNAYAAVGCERTETKDGAPPIVCTRIDLHNPRYFNSGFMILNLNKMRHDNIPEKLIDYKLHGKMWNMDQDALNAVIGYNVVYFDYNTHLLYHQLVSEELREKYGKGTDRNLIQKCTVLHFTSHRKPWKTRLPIVTRMWLKYYKCTPYSDEKIKFARLFDRLYEKYYYRDGQGLLYRILNCKR